MLRAVLTSLYERVFKSYKSTLLGIAVVAAAAVVETLQAQELPTWARSVVGIVAAILALYRGKQPAPELKPVP